MPKKIYTVSYYDGVPMIRLTGKWLIQNGFNIGDKLKFINGKNMIILTKLSKADTEKLTKEYEIKILKQKLNDLI